MNELKTMLLGVLVLLATTLIGQPGHHDKQKMHKGEKIAKELNLSTDQETQLEKIKEDFKTEMKNISEDSDLSKDEKVDKIERALEDRKSRTDEVYTLEQKTQMESIRREQTAERIYNKGELKKKTKARNEEMKSYYDEHMRPDLERMRKDFDANLESEDRVQINKWRTDHVAHKAKRKEHKKDVKNGEKTKEELHRNRTSHAGRKKYHKEIHSLLNKYEDELDALRAANAELFDEWEAEQKVIREKYKTKDESKGRRMGSKGKRGKGHRAQHRDLLGQRFLLMDY